MVVLRYAAFLLLAFLLTLLGWFLASLLVLLQPRTGRWAARVGALWGRAILVAAGCRVEVQGRERFERETVRMVVANHASLLDPPAVLHAVPANVRFIMKKELASFPLIGWYSRLAGHFFLDRRDAREGRRILDRAIGRARRHRLFPAIFPEGTRSRDGRLQPLRAGSFQLALEGGLPVQPVAILGTHAVMPKGAWGPRRRGRVVIRFGDPIPTEGLRGSPGRKVLAERVRTALLALGVPP